jgi:ADP-heptose:LPS heptosyltransferase
VGVRSQWHSFLFLNAGVRQKRSQADHHEADYNFELVDILAQKLKTGSYTRKSPMRTAPVLKLKAGTNDILLHKWHLKPGSYFIVHPGMAGSSLNWPQEKYINFITAFHLQYPDIKIVMTGTAADTPYLNRILNIYDGKDFFLNVQGKVTSYELLSLLGSSRGILAPSTGVLHLAASLGVPSFGIFSPIKVQRPTRWAPRGRFTRTYMPNTESPDCMSKLDIFPDFKKDFEKSLSEGATE